MRESQPLPCELLCITYFQEVRTLNEVTGTGTRPCLLEAWQVERFQRLKSIYKTYEKKKKLWF